MLQEEQQFKKSRVIKSWAKIYDLVNFFIFLMFKGTKRLHRDIIFMAGVMDGDRILDIGCGTGEFLFEIAKRYNTIKAYGIDASEEMISIARKKATSKGYCTLNFEFVQAERLPYKSEMFDCAFNVFLLHHLPMESKLQCLREVYRVLKPGKPFLLVDVDKPTNLLGRIIGMTRWNIREIRENMEQPLTVLLKKTGFSSSQLMRKDHGIFSFIRCKK